MSPVIDKTVIFEVCADCAEGRTPLCTAHAGDCESCRRRRLVFTVHCP